MQQTCKACGAPDKFDFTVPDNVWSAVVPPSYRNVVVCLYCFDEFAVERGVDYATAVTELSPPAYVGTALTAQTCVGFALTMISIWLIPPVVRVVGWRWAFASLALGPALGVLAMGRLRGLPEALRLAGGRR